MAQPHRLYARDLPDLQHNKLMTSEGMKGVSDLDRSQRLTGPMCSSKQPCQLLPIAAPRKSSVVTWSQFWRRCFILTPTATDLANLQSMRCVKPVSAAGDTTGCSISMSKDTSTVL